MTNTTELLWSSGLLDKSRHQALAACVVKVARTQLCALEKRPGAWSRITGANIRTVFHRYLLPTFVYLALVDAVVYNGIG